MCINADTYHANYLLFQSRFIYHYTFLIVYYVNIIRNLNLNKEFKIRNTKYICIQAYLKNMYCLKILQYERRLFY